METPERATLEGKPPSSLWDSPTFAFMNNLSPIVPMEAIDSPDIARMFRMTHTKPLSIQESEKRRRILFAAEAEIQENVISIYSAMKPEAHEGEGEKARNNFELTGGSIDPFTSAMPIVEGNNLTKSLSMDKDLCPTETEVECHIIDCDVQKDSTIRIIEESSQESPKKKRLKTENGAESDGCKRCKCKKSKCLKLYCECFAAGLYCTEPCSCQECFNKPIHEEIIHSTRKKIEARNALAFATKLIRDHQVSCLEGDGHMTPASARHRQGCNCKKSSCSKKYCECYQAGVGCSIYCRCEECKNSFGRRDGFKEIEIKASLEMVSGRQMINSQIGLHSAENTLSIVPLQSNRPDGISIFSSAMAPQSTGLSVGGLTGCYAPNMFWKPEMVLPQLISDNNFTTIGEVDGISGILRPTPPSTTGVKTVSPNRKRVHPLHNDSGLMPPTCKSFRKLP